MLRTIRGSYMPLQFDHPANPEVHRKTTAEEIWHDTRGEVDVFVAGIGTGGTITGVGEVLKARNPSVRVIDVKPDTSPGARRSPAPACIAQWRRVGILRGWAGGGTPCRRGRPRGTGGPS